MLKKFIKRNPKLYTYCQHLQRRKNIFLMRKRKELSWGEKIKLVEKTYLDRIGHKLEWDKLCSYTEKMQWAKMYDYDRRKTVLSDKLLVREWVADKIGETYLIPLLGAWDSFEQIDFRSLPNQFVLKTNNGSGTNLIVRNKNSLDWNQVKMLVTDWIDMDFAFYNPFEFQYAGIKPKIIAEKLMTVTNGDLPDYKFLCFEGKPVFCWVDMDRYTKHKRNIYDMNWRLQSWNQLNYGNYEADIPCPENFEEMKQIAETLAQGFSHVRVDLYDINGKIYFGEMTFTNGSGFEKIVPDEADMYLGELWHIDTSKRDICGLQSFIERKNR